MKKKTTISPTKQFGEELGMGGANTRTITYDTREMIQNLNNNTSTIRLINPSAAEICSKLNQNSNDDWFLPSLKEMEMMWFHQTEQLKLKRKNVYWTSTSSNSNKALAFAFKDTPLIKAVNQNQKLSIRPMRYF